MKQGLTFLKGLARNAVLWGIGWGILAVGVSTALWALGLLEPQISWIDTVGMSIKVGVMGGIASVAFALAIRVFYRGRRLADINPLKFAVLGGAATGIFVPLFMQTMNLLSGGNLVPWHLIRGDIATATVFGALVAGASLTLAQRASRDMTDAVDDPAGESLLSAPPASPIEVADRTRSERVG